MNKRYQVFISSTFRDLIEERQAVLKGILQIDYMPAGMELFPATDDSAWQLIREVIDGSDYYVLVIGGRYGSIDSAGLGYTEKEYDYAYDTKRPVIALLHKNPDNLPREKTETEEKFWKKLLAFRSKVEKRHTCVYWESADELKAQVIVALTGAAKRHPAIGWVRADEVPTGAAVEDVLRLRERISQLESEAASRSTSPPPGTEDLAQGEDEFSSSVSFAAREPGDTYPYEHDRTYSIDAELAWNAIFAAVAPSMIQEAKDSVLRQALQRAFMSAARNRVVRDKRIKGKELRDWTVPAKDVETCVVQLRALGLIEESNKKRSLRDSGQYWKLTPYGHTAMVQLRAIRRKRLGDLFADEAAVSEADEDSDDEKE
ncbi:MAG TPA: DUF4062 domain-containing protein [Steroidobacteraceae bacterium]|nr:DUF4062 domain-containing protein [Steroidobacteraceae bacterium]